MCRPLSLSYAVRAAAIRVVRVVVVDVAAGVDIPRIIRVAAIRRAQTGIHGAGTAYSLIRSDIFVSVLITFMPSFCCVPDFDRHLSPMFDSFCRQMEAFPAQLDGCKMLSAYPDRFRLFSQTFCFPVRLLRHVDFIRRP